MPGRILFPMTDLSTDFFRQNEWATLRLIEVCRGLTDEQLSATAVGTYGSIRDTLRHLVTAEANYAFRFDPSIRRLPKDDPWPGLTPWRGWCRPTSTCSSRLPPGRGSC